MARYRIAKDGHPYLTHGYPLVDEIGQQTAQFATYQVNAGAERLFRLARFEEGDKVSEEVFYALLLDGDLYNTERPNGILASAVPNSIVAGADAEIEKTGFNRLDLSGATCLLDVFERSPFSSTKDPLFGLSMASWLWIYTKRRLQS